MVKALWMFLKWLFPISTEFGFAKWTIREKLYIGLVDSFEFGFANWTVLDSYGWSGRFAILWICLKSLVRVLTLVNLARSQSVLGGPYFYPAVENSEDVKC